MLYYFVCLLQWHIFRLLNIFWRPLTKYRGQDCAVMTSCEHFSDLKEICYRSFCQIFQDRDAW